MLAILLALALAAPAAPTLPPSQGPTPAPIKGLRKPVSMGADVGELVRWSVKDMGQAVVVVVGELGVVDIPKVNPGIHIFNGGLTLFRPRLPMPTDLPVAPWMDLNAVGNPGNPAGKMIPLGWGY